MLTPLLPQHLGALAPAGSPATPARGAQIGIHPRRVSAAPSPAQAQEYPSGSGAAAAHRSCLSGLRPPLRACERLGSLFFAAAT